MGRRINIDRENNEISTTRALRETGDSIVVGLPSEILQGAGLELGDDVRVVANMNTGKITLRKSPEDDETASENASSS